MGSQGELERPGRGIEMLQESCAKTRGLAEQYVATSPASMDRLHRTDHRVPEPGATPGWIARIERGLDGLSRDLFQLLLGGRSPDL